MTETDERWLPVVGYEGSYEVSDLGRIVSLPKSSRHCRAVLRPRVEHGKGYRIIAFSAGGRQYKHRLHVVVARAFLGPRPESAVIRHLDGDPSNNALTNLRYGTAAENMADTIRHGRHNHVGKTHCHVGHPFDSQNTFIRRYDGARLCRACRRGHARAAYARTRAKEATNA